ncbi:MAG TPA: hypothetical protein VGM88_09350 [Kofleriaceae bacterium]
MQIVGFTATPDLVGRRVRIQWQFVPDDGESVANVPQVTVRRKTGDFDFPAAPASGADPFLVYASLQFPPPAVTITELTDWETTDDDTGERTAWSALSISQIIGGRQAEIARRSTGLVYGTDGVPRRQVVELLDLGGSPGALVPRQVYYYEIFTDAIAAAPDLTPYRATALVTERYGHGRTLYEMMPETYRRHDVQQRPDEPGTATVPEMARRAGQLRRLIELFGNGLDMLRSSAEGLRTLHDIDNVDAAMLPQLASYIGWNLSYNVEIPLQRNELKSASLFYRGVGTVPNLRAIVNHYTGWFSQIAEFDQNIARSNEVAQYNLFWNVPDGGEWRGADDASFVLGFGPGNRSATGGAAAATLLGTDVEPFALRPGMELTLAADGDLSAAVRFLPDDFLDIGAATAYEVAKVLDRSFYEISATAEGGRLRIRSNSVGSESALAILPATTSLLSLEGAPAGRLCPFVDRQRAIRLFYEAVLPRAGVAGPGIRQIRYKTFTGGAWRSAQGLDPIGNPPTSPQGAPAAVELANGRILIAFVVNPDTASAVLRTQVGVPALPIPARVLSAKRGPFALVDGTVLAVTGSFGTELFTVNASDYASIGAARAVEIANALNGQLSFVRASDAGDGSLALATADAGPDVRLAVDFARSTSARALGFDPRSSSGTGAWDDTITWVAWTETTAARYADLCLVPDGVGGAWLLYAVFDGAWSVRCQHCDATGQLATPPTIVSVGGISREPCAALAPDGSLVVVYAQQTALDDSVWQLRMRVRAPNGTWGAEAAPYTLPAGDASRDREPALTWVAGGGLQIMFRSNRQGGAAIWTVTLPAALTPAGAPVTVLPDEPSNDGWPAPLPYGSDTILFWRSDRNVALGQADVETTGKSVRVPDLATVKRYAGSPSANPGDLLRNRGIGLWGDLYAFTPQEPEQDDMRLLTDKELYTPNTIGLYVSRGRYGSPLTDDELARLRQLLASFLPVHLRAILIVVAGSTVEYVYDYDNPAPDGPPNLIGEAWSDAGPLLDTYGGALDDYAVALPGWRWIYSNRKTDVSANPADPETLKLRTYYPPPK